MMSDMTDGDSSKKGTAHENLPEMLDNVIRQLNFTRKMIIILVISFVIIVPIIAYIGFLSQSTAGVGVYIPIIGGAVFLAWLGVGIFTKIPAVQGTRCMSVVLAGASSSR